MNNKQFMVKIYEIIHVNQYTGETGWDLPVLHVCFMHVLKIQLQSCVTVLYIDYTHMDVQG